MKESVHNWVNEPPIGKNYVWDFLVLEADDMFSIFLCQKNVHLAGDMGKRNF